MTDTHVPYYYYTYTTTPHVPSQRPRTQNHKHRCAVVRGRWRRRSRALCAARCCSARCAQGRRQDCAAWRAGPPRLLAPPTSEALRYGHGPYVRRAWAREAERAGTARRPGRGSVFEVIMRRATRDAHVVQPWALFRSRRARI
jgi:hypothetical protein